jgi:hypothetical protein
MSSTPFSKQCEILKDFYMTHSGGPMDEDMTSLIYMYDLGFPAAMLYLDNAATLTDKGIQYVTETWQGVCDALDIDPLGDYDNWSHMVLFANDDNFCCEYCSYE